MFAGAFAVCIFTGAGCGGNGGTGNLAVVLSAFMLVGNDTKPELYTSLSSNGNLPIPTLGPAAATPGLPNLPTPALVNNAQFGNIDPVSGLTLSEQVYLDPTEKIIRRTQRRLT